MHHLLVGLTLPHAAQVLGLAYGVVDQWSRSHLIHTCGGSRRGRGRARRCGFNDLVAARVVEVLKEQGVCERRIHPVVEFVEGGADWRGMAGPVYLMCEEGRVRVGPSVEWALRDGDGRARAGVVVDLALVVADVERLYAEWSRARA